ncbi:hypothetical protein M569_04975 [Genlisea aurea]|uniref:Glycine-rich protein n=1 Tax=Genlisea aurea TaxID=192259 RepID=S8CSI0_9LAMI|nr:hypothetical protein M569_04975 [Genlisea aurea]
MKTAAALVYLVALLLIPAMGFDIESPEHRSSASDVHTVIEQAGGGGGSATGSCSGDAGAQGSCGGSVSGGGGSGGQSSGEAPRKGYFVGYSHGGVSGGGDVCKFGCCTESFGYSHKGGGYYGCTCCPTAADGDAYRKSRAKEETTRN